jgi:hypothetical protein
LPALLSQALVAVTIEADNELEHRLPHRTTRGPAASSRRDRIVRPTPAGLWAQDASRRLLAVIEERWQARYGTDCTGRPRESLPGLLDPLDGGQSRQASSRVAAGAQQDRPPRGSDARFARNLTVAGGRSM